MLYVGYYYIERERERDKYVCGAKNLLGLNLKGVKPPTHVQKLAPPDFEEVHCTG
jgi:hypothetical protein